MDDVSVLGFPRRSGDGEGFLRPAPRLGEQHPTAFFRHRGRIQRAVGQRLHGLRNCRFRIAGEQKHIVASEQRIPNARALADEVGKALHAHGVGEHQPLESELAPQQGVHDERGQGGGLRFRAVQSGHVKVGDHDGTHAAVKRVTERREFDGIETRPIVADGRKRGVRVAVAVAVAWEVFGRRQNVNVLQPVGVRLPQRTDPFHVLPKAPAPNHRVDGVGIHVHHRGEVDVDPCRAKALANHLPKHPHQRRVPRGAERHGAREGAGAVQAHP